MITFCPRCGAQFVEEIRGEWIDSSLRCRDCGLAVGQPPPMLAAGPEDDEVEYDLGEWPVTERGAATVALAIAEIPYRWEADLVLVVPTVAEDEVDRLLDELEADDELGDEHEAHDENDGGEGDGGEEAQAAMADLFVAADRLQHAPDDGDVAADVSASATVVRASAPPYGIERPVWRQIQGLASTLVADLEEAAEADLVAEDARAVRDFLRDFV